MKKRKLYQFFATALALAFVGCSHDELTDENSVTGGNNSKDAVYMNITVQLPVKPGTRSTTDDNGGSSDGTEVGLDRENRVHSVLLVLADKDNKFIGCAEKSESLVTEQDGKITTVQSISKSVLSQYYGGDNSTLGTEKQQINVFVFCNPTSALKGIFEGLSAEDATWYDQVCSISESPTGGSDNAAIWGGPDHQGGFLMSSSAISKKKLPANFSAWDNFTTVDKPFKLSGNNSIIDGNSDNAINNDGAIKVERSVARFDFKDGSPSNTPANTYDVVKDQDENLVMQIQLQKMALVNMSKNFYYLRRVSTNGLSANATLCGIETSSNYVVDTDATEKNAGSIITDKTYADHFNFCLGNSTGEKWTIDETARNQWFTSKILNVLGGDNDNPDWEGTSTYGDYKIWRYVTENTTPGETSNQKNGISTGIIFKGKMIAPEGASSTLADALKGASGDPAEDPILYAYSNNIYVTWKEVRAMAIEKGVGSPMYTAAFGNTEREPVAEKKASEGTEAVPAVYSDDEESADYKWNAWYNAGTKTTENLKTFKAAATKAGFTLYESSTDDNVHGYYCYYFYWNRHNDNGNNGVMNPMEFAVVRNNVYKLAVTNIRKLGHPRVSENDPDPIDPNNPDEEGNVYLSVSVEVLPWVVRVNNIDF